MNENLPPGVGIADMPGNRKEDEEWERFISQCVDLSNENKMAAVEMGLALRMGIVQMQFLKRLGLVIAQREMLDKLTAEREGP